MTKLHNIILLFSASFFAVVGCKQSSFEDNTPNTPEGIISYKSSVEDTRASITEIGELEAYGKFSVAAFTNDDTKGHYFSDIVSYNGTKWASAFSRYWPVSGTLNMYSYSPLENSTINNAQDSENYSLTYLCPQNIENQVDLLVSTLTDLKPKNIKVPEPVDLKFYHALSGIQFNVEISGESKVTLNNILINYVNIEKQRTYDFNKKDWGDSEGKYFDTADGLTTQININKSETASNPDDKVITFTDIDSTLMLIPQPISSSAADPHYLSIRVAYTLGSGESSYGGTYVETGTMPLPLPSGEDSYIKGKIYIYNIKISGNVITFGDIQIEDQNDPKPAYGNIDLRLITEPTDPDSITGYTPLPDDEKSLYFTTALRVQKLLEEQDAVRDFVVVGPLDAVPGNYHGNGKLGFYGGASSPFTIGAKLAEQTLGTEQFYSIDLRGTYGYPDYQDLDKTPTPSSADNDLQPNAKVLTPGLFDGVKGLTEVMLPHGLKAIGDHSFANCDALTTIDISDVIHIEDGAFQLSDQLHTVIGSSLTRIHTNGFDRCRALKNIDLTNVVEVDDLGFVNCESLTNVNITNLKVIGAHAFDGCYNLTIQENTILPAFDTVAEYAFAKCRKLGTNGARIDLTHASKVGAHAFSECYEIKLADGELFALETVGAHAFTDCIHIGTDYEISMPKIKSVGTSAFQGCTEMNIIEGLDRLTVIDTSAFQGCTKLSGPEGGISFNNVEEVRPYAFTDCKSLTRMEMKNLADGKWGQDFFVRCHSLKILSLPNITIPQITYEKEVIVDGIPTIKEVVCSIPDMIRSIPEYEYEIDAEGNSIITKTTSQIEVIDLSSLVYETPDWSGFQNMDKLHTVKIGSATKLGAGAFQNCTMLKTIELGSVTSIGSYSFQNCSSLEALELTKVRTIGSGIVSGCSSLVKLILPNAEGTYSGSWGELALSSLKYVDLSSISRIEGAIFAGSTTLNAIDLSSVTSFGTQSQSINNLTALQRLDLSGLIDGEADTYEHLFWNCENLDQCEIWLSDEQANQAIGTTWAGITWKAIHSTSDNHPFELIK